MDVNISSEAFASLVVYSSAAPLDARTTRLVYEFENRGNVPVSILINLPMTELMEKDVPLREAWPLAPNSRRSFRTVIESPVSIQTAAVRVSDADNKIALAFDLAGVYAPIIGIRRYQDEVLFKSVKWPL